MNNLIMLAMVIPIMTGIILVFLRPFIRVQRWISVFSLACIVGVSIYLLGEINTSGMITLAFGDWDAPFGIVFVADSIGSSQSPTDKRIIPLVLISADIYIKEVR